MKNEKHINNEKRSILILIRIRKGFWRKMAVLGKSSKIRDEVGFQP